MGQRAVAVPGGAEIAQLFEDVIQRWHTVQPRLEWEAALSIFGSDCLSFAGQIAYLGLVNCFQWHLEDECRANYTSLAILARLKCSIDLSNERRVRAIDAIDHQMLLCLPRSGSSAPTARLALVTPGSLMDRLSILELKHYHAQRTEFQKSQLAALFAEQIQDLCGGIDELLDDLYAGRQHLKVYGTVKLYGVERSLES